jgi:hypothetical protein
MQRVVANRRRERAKDISSQSSRSTRSYSSASTADADPIATDGSKDCQQNPDHEQEPNKAHHQANKKEAM